MKPLRRLLLLLSPLTLSVTLSAELPKVAYEEFATGFISPTGMIPYRDGDHAFLVVDQTGVISFLGERGGSPKGTFLDLRPMMVKLKDGFDERGLLGIAIHPDFKGNGKVYVHYSAPLQKDGTEGYDHTAHISEFIVPKGSDAADPESERVLLAVDEPQWNHDGGNPTFGPDGYLYIGLGDGGGGNDLGKGHEEGGNGQNLDRLLGKILRIDVDGGDPYAIPKDNPLVGKDGRDEIYAWGIRNPWGISFDPDEKGRLYVADVGQNRFEEINIVNKGGNYGWPLAEGNASFEQEDPNKAAKLEETTAPENLAPPILVYPHNKNYGKSSGYGISVTGGHVYRGKALPALQGAYVFADWGTSWALHKAGLFAGVRSSDGRWTMEILPGDTPSEIEEAMVTGIARDSDGELFVLTNGKRGPEGTDGTIWKIVPAG